MDWLEVEAIGVQAQGGRCIGLVHQLQALVQVVLDCRERGDDGRGAEAVCNHGEVGEMSLDAWVQDRLGAGVAQGRPVLVQQVHQLLADHPGVGR